MPPPRQGNLPLFINSHVISGYKRGSKLLGVPTANLCIENDEVMQNQIRDWNGVYIGWAKVSDKDYMDHPNQEQQKCTSTSSGCNDNGTGTGTNTSLSSSSSPSPHYNRVFKSVLSIGENPHFDGKQKTVEPHILHEFPEDFYNKRMKLLVCAHLREQEKYSNLDELIEAIHNDIRLGSEMLDQDDMKALKDHPFFNDSDDDEPSSASTEQGQDNQQA